MNGARAGLESRGMKQVRKQHDGTRRVKTRWIRWEGQNLTHLPVVWIIPDPLNYQREGKKGAKRSWRE